MKAPRWIVLLLLLVVAFSFACGDDDDDDDDDNDDASPGDDDNNGDDDTAGDDDDDDATPGPGSWDGITIADIEAPDQYTVTLTLSANPGDNAAGAAGIYSLNSEHGSLAVESATADGADVTLTTDKQKLGVEYTLRISPADTDLSIVSSFDAADTAKFWAYDFATGGQYQITAYRAGIGETCVVYVEEGQSVSDTEYSIGVFDDEIYPIETEIFDDPDDVDGNGRIVILSLDGGNYYGGYFSGINQYTDAQTMGWWGLHSNEADMIHINSLYESLMVESVVPHEFQHLLYNAAHQDNYDYWAYHDEGLAEAAVHAVFGVNQGARDYFLADPESEMGDGLSLVNWIYANYDNYAQAYLWWMYLAGRLDGVDSLSDFFDMVDGNPGEVNDFIATELGSTMVDEVFNYEIALWLQEDSGAYSFNGTLSWTPGTAPTVTAGTTSLNLEPYGGALFKLAEGSVNYPGTQGANIVYAGIDGDGNVDLTAPFDVDGGVLLAHNLNDNYGSFPTEHSGPDLPAQASMKTKRDFVPSPAWLDPPPLHPERMHLIEAWRYRTLERIRTSK